MIKIPKFYLFWQNEQNIIRKIKFKVLSIFFTSFKPFLLVSSGVRLPMVQGMRSWPSMTTCLTFFSGTLTRSVVKPLAWNVVANPNEIFNYFQKSNFIVNAEHRCKGHSNWNPIPNVNPCVKNLKAISRGMKGNAMSFRAVKQWGIESVLVHCSFRNSKSSFQNVKELKWVE